MLVQASFIIALLICSYTQSFRLQLSIPTSRFSMMSSVASDEKEIRARTKSFLNTVLSSRTSLDQKKIIVNELQGLRAVENDPNIPRNEDKSKPAVWNGDKTSFLDNLVLEIDSVKGWPCQLLFGAPLPLPSYRVKLAAARRVMSLILAEETVSPNLNSTQYLQGRKRRALSIMIGQLQSQTKGIRGLEKEAKQKSESMNDMLKRTPEGLETPNYSVLYSQPTWEVRQYESFSVCSTVMNLQNSTGPGAFNSLAGYIFGKNKNDEKMAMTTPVLSRTDSSGTKKMSFVMPSRFWKDPQNLATAPLPVDESDIKLEMFVDGKDPMASIWYGGYSDAIRVQEMYSKLKSRLNVNNEWQLKDLAAEPLVLQYNDPFQPPWKRRNEVCVPVIRRT